MRQPQVRIWPLLLLIAAATITARVPLLAAKAPAADTQPKKVALGGPRGIVRNSDGYPIEGMMVQLISQKTSIRTTVYTNVLGQYEFPKLEAGAYKLRTPRAQIGRASCRERV